MSVEEVPLFDLPPTEPRKLYRATDPDTSRQAAATVQTRTQKMRLLNEYKLFPAGLTDEEAGHFAGISSAWKRCSDLRNSELIVALKNPDGTLVTRQSTSGKAQMVCVITDKGIATLTASKGN